MRMTGGSSLTENTLLIATKKTKFDIPFRNSSSEK